MPIRIVTKEVMYIHKLSLTLEDSMSISSPTVPGLAVTASREAPVFDVYPDPVESSQETWISSPMRWQKSNSSPAGPERWAH